MRKKPHKLSWLEIIKLRGTLTSVEKKEYVRLNSGFKGEQEFDSHFLHFAPNISPIWDDLNFSYNGQLFQMDKSFVSRNIWHFIDVKNYQGNYEYING